MNAPTHDQFEEIQLVAEKAGELHDRVSKVESELGAQTKTLESAALVLDAAIKGLGALKSSVLENDIGALQLALNDKTAALAREIGRFESAVAEIDRRAETGDDAIKLALLETAQALRAQFEAKSAEIGEWSARVEKEIAAHSVALAAIPPVIKGADAVGFNPAGEWEAGKAFARMDLVSYAGSSYVSNADGNTDKPSKSARYTLIAKRGSGTVSVGGIASFKELTDSVSPSQVVPGSSSYAVGDVLYAGTTGALSKLTAGTSGQLLSTQGAGAAPIWVTATGGAGDFNGPASATDNAVVRFDGTGGKTAQNSVVIVSDTGAVSGITTLATSGVATLTNTTASTGVGTGALQVTGGAYIGGASVVAGTVTVANNVTVTGGTNPVATSDAAILLTNSSSPRLALVRNSSTANSRIFEVLNSGDGVVNFRFVNDAYGAATNVLTLNGTSAAAGVATFAGAVAVGNTVTTVNPTSPNRTITIVVGGVTLYIAAKTTND